VEYRKAYFLKTSQLIIDIIIFILAYFAAFILRFEGIPNPNNSKQLLILFPFIALARFICFYVFSIYSIVWRYISIGDVILIVKASLPITVLLFVGRIFLPLRLFLFRLPLSIIALEFLLVLLGTLSVRAIRRLFFELSERERFENKETTSKKKKAILIGAGNAGNMVIKELKQRADLGIDVLGFIDDDPRKINTTIQGIKVIGNTSQIPEIVRKQKIEEAIITIANASSKDIRRIVDVCEGTKIKVKIVPGLFEMLDDKVKITKLREINIDDLLGRSIISFENYLPEVTAHYQNKRILVTGAGGSIGSELCRQLASVGPKKLILLDKDENSVYEIDNEIQTNFPALKVNSLIADIRNYERLQYIFEKYQPEVIFHAAAHKHVPLMEYNVAEAILNNVSGTRNVAMLADQFKIKNFIFISTDKAVNPKSVMGATKKIGEIIIQEIAARSDAKCSCVRFGNVLGSRGSVVPLFQKQIAKGGPITITHPDMRRYFMSISEAVQLIIRVGTIGNNGEIFVLDMGEPIKIRELARDLIKLSGYAEDDFEIRYIGIRPGEKLFEEILVNEEKTKATNFKKIFIAPPIEIDRPNFSKNLSALSKAAQECNEKRIIELLKDMGIGYQSENREDDIILALPG
jgi:FlaA1/EpsC-like NDP-sugar epimerase